MAKNLTKDPHGLSKKEFNRIVKLVPFIACELIIVNKKKEFLLAWRHDKYWRGWHFPGGLLRYRETFEERIQAVARDELGIHINSFRFIDVFNYLDDPRGHSICLLFLCRTPDTPMTGKWFRKTPKNIIKHHRQYVDIVFKKKKAGVSRLPTN